MISSYQLLCVLLLTRIAAEIFYPASGGYDAAAFAAAAVSEFIQIAVALPVMLYSLKGNCVFAAITRKSRLCGWAVGLTTAFLLALLAVYSAVYTAEFAQRTVLSGMSGAVIVVLIAGFAVYAAVKGVEALSRSSVLLLAGCAVVTAVTVLAAAPHMRELSIRPEVGADFWGQVYERLTRGGGYMIFSALLPYINRGKKELSPCGCALLFGGLSLAVTLLMQLFGMAVLGEFYGLAEYPFIAAAQLSDIALFKRLDGFAAAIWAVGGAMRCAVLLLAEFTVIKAVRNAAKGETHEAENDRSNTGNAAA